MAEPVEAIGFTSPCPLPAVVARHLVAAAASSLFIVGCVSKEPPVDPANDQMSITDSVGHAAVEATPPVDTSHSEVSLIQVAEFGAPGGWNEPHRAIVAHGKVIVLDRGAMSLHLIDPSSGRELERVGREGDGPGELRNPMELFATRDGFAVWDVGRGGLVEFDPNGVHARDTRLPSLTMRVLVLPSGEAMTWPVGGGATLLALAEVGSGDGRPLAELDRFTADEKDRCLDANVSAGRVVAVRCSAADLAVLRADGSIERRHLFGVVAPRRGDDELARIRARLLARMAADGIPVDVAVSTVGSIISNFAEPRVFSNPVILSDGTALILQQLEEELDPESAIIHAVSMSGELIGSVTLPYRVIRISALSADRRLLMITEDPATGERRVTEYRWQG